VKVLLHRVAEKYIDRLQSGDRDRFYAAFFDLEKEPPAGNIKPYKSSPDSFRLMVGNYRAIFRFVDNKILVTHIEPRGQAYKKKTKTKRG